MKNKLFDGVLINLLKKGPTASSLDDVAHGFMGKNGVSQRYKNGVKQFAIDDFDGDTTATGLDGEELWIFKRHYRPRVYLIFGYFDLAVVQLCDSAEIIAEMTTLPDISATQNIFGLRSLTPTTDFPEEKDRLRALELCSPILPYLFICNVKVHPILQMALGKDMQALLNAHFKQYLHEAEVMDRCGDDPAALLMTIGILDTYGWNDLTLLIHGARFDHMARFVWNEIRALCLGDLIEFEHRETVEKRLRQISMFLRSYGMGNLVTGDRLYRLPVFSHTETIPCIDYACGDALAQGSSPTGDLDDLEDILAKIDEKINHKIERHVEGDCYLAQVPRSRLVAIRKRIVDEMQRDRCECFSFFSIRPGCDMEFGERIERMFKDRSRRAPTEIVLGQTDALMGQTVPMDEFSGSQCGEFLKRLQRVLRIRSYKPEADGSMTDRANRIVRSSKTALSLSAKIEQPVAESDPFEVLRQNLPRLFRFRENGDSVVSRPVWSYCRKIQLPLPLHISLEHALEPYYSFLQDANLFSQYIDLYLPLLLIVRQIQSAADRPDDFRLVPEHIAREIRQFDHAFQARFRASHLNSEGSETTLEFKAHTVTPLDTIQCVIDCFVFLFLGFGRVAGFPIISVSTRPTVHASHVFSVELNSFHLLYPEFLVTLFHELSHLYWHFGQVASYGGDLDGVQRASVPAPDSGCLLNIFDHDDARSRKRWRVFARSLARSRSYVDARKLALQAEEILSDLLLLFGVCQNKWDLYLWYITGQIEMLGEHFPVNPVDDEEQCLHYIDLMIRIFFVYFYHVASQVDDPVAAWRDSGNEETFRQLAKSVRGQSRKIREFFGRERSMDLDSKSWQLVRALLGDSIEKVACVINNALDGKVDRKFWVDDVSEDNLDGYGSLSSMFVTVLSSFFRKMLEDIVVNSCRAFSDEELYNISRDLELDYDALSRGEGRLSEIFTLLRAITWRDLDPEEYLESLREAPSGGLDSAILSSDESFANDPFERSQVFYAKAYMRVKKALYALVKYFYLQNRAETDDLRYLYRDPETGRPETLQNGRSDVDTSPCAGGKYKPLAVVVDRRGVLFCRSIQLRQRAFQYRNAVIREIADIHVKLRPAKMAEIVRLTEAYRAEMIEAEQS